MLRTTSLLTIFSGVLDVTSVMKCQGSDKLFATHQIKESTNLKGQDTFFESVRCHVIDLLRSGFLLPREGVRCQVSQKVIDERWLLTDNSINLLLGPFCVAY